MPQNFLVNRPGVRGDFWPGKARTEFMPTERSVGKPMSRPYPVEEKVTPGAQ
jgi:hypothetical protein